MVSFFYSMLGRIGKMDINGSYSIDIFGFKTLNKEWPNRYEFLAWEYGKHHLKKSNMDQLNCCTFALGGNFEQIHPRKFLH